MKTQVTEGKKETPIVKIDEPKANPLLDKMQKINELSILTKGYHNLNQTLKNLDSFKFEQNSGNYQNTNTLTILDNERNEFKTSNIVLIDAVIEHLKNKLSEKLEEHEKKIVSININ